MLISRVLANLRRTRPQAEAAQPGANAPAATPADEANPLAQYFFSNSGRLIYKWHHYFEIYHRHFAAFRGRSPVVVEIGAFHGGSLQMWRHYFGAGARIVGVDIDPRCSKFADESTTVLIGDQADPGFLAELRKQVPRIDILIDDGGHRMDQQRTTFEELYPHIQPHGVYLCEDMHTSYLPDWEGGYRREGTFVEYSKGLIDQLYRWYRGDMPRYGAAGMTESTYALHFYDSVLVIEKRPMSLPVQTQTGIPSF